MDNLPLMAATAWAQAHAGESKDPVVFGTQVAQVYVAANAVERESCELKDYSLIEAMVLADAKDVADAIARQAGYGAHRPNGSVGGPASDTEGPINPQPHFPRGGSPLSASAAAPAAPQSAAP